MKQLKTIIKERFNKQYPHMRLLAVQLNGFTHTIFMDNGDGASSVEALRISNYTTFEDDETVRAIFEGIPNYTYQNKPVEYVYIKPNERKIRTYSERY